MRTPSKTSSKMPIKFLANKNVIVFGSTGVGKTQFILEVIRQRLVHPFPENVYYMYNVEQDFMTTWNETEVQPIKFIKGLQFDEVDTSKPSMLIIDDLILATDKNVAEMFIMGAHHKSVSVFYLTQNLFHNCDLFRLMSKNTHYYVIFENQRNFSQIATLARQTALKTQILESYLRASKKPRGFIVLSFAPELPRELSVVTDWWELCPSIYL